MGDRDGELKMIHLVTLFALFEELLKEASIFFSLELKDKDRNISIINWFFGKDETKSILEDKQLEELKLAKETRNCYIHNGNKIDNKFVEAYKDARIIEPIAAEEQKIFENFPNQFHENLFHQIEDWHKLIVDTSNKIKEKIENK